VPTPVLEIEPDWLASIVQAPTETNLTVLLETVQGDEVADAKLPGSPGLAVALMVNGAASEDCDGSAVKEIA
jgi:hypothetical protein